MDINARILASLGAAGAAAGAGAGTQASAAGAGKRKADRRRDSISSSSSADARGDRSDEGTPSDQEDDFMSGDDYEDDEEDTLIKEVNSWGKDLIGDKADRARLEAMNDLERSQILAERAEKVQHVRERMEIRRKLKAGKIFPSTSKGDSDRRRSSRKQTSKDKKSMSLKALKSAREKKPGDSAEDSVESHKRRKRGDEEYGEITEKSDIPEEILTKADLDSVRVSRTDLENWINARFKREQPKGAVDPTQDEWYGVDSIVKDCYVRVGLGLDEKKEKIYRVAKIVELVGCHPYEFGKTVSNKRLLVSHGKATKAFRMDYISNDRFSESEVMRYIKVAGTEGEKLPSRKDVTRKAEELKKIRNHVFTPDELDMMVRIKKDIKKVPVNIAAEKLRLQTERDKALHRNDQEEANRITERLKELDEYVKERNSSPATSVAPSATQTIQSKLGNSPAPVTVIKSAASSFINTATILKDLSTPTAPPQLVMMVPTLPQPFACTDLDDSFLDAINV
ncbi:hypothetical protein BJ742DRAFT_837659 [Cladochytrium replicatum]|nr:hypothetical protein BJ742DRAFT_837659 [Cladochytrium replicatum]